MANEVKDSPVFLHQEELLNTVGGNRNSATLAHLIPSTVFARSPVWICTFLVSTHWFSVSITPMHSCMCSSIAGCECNSSGTVNCIHTH